MSQNHLEKPVQWRMGAQARLKNQGRDRNPFKFPNPNPKDNEPWSHWNHGWGWADEQIRTLTDLAEYGIVFRIPQRSQLV